MLLKTFNTDSITTELLLEILRVPGFNVCYQAPLRDSRLAAQRIQADMNEMQDKTNIKKIEVIKAGFFRNRGAYIVGRTVFEDHSILPLVIALLNDQEGIYVDAILTTESATHNLFSTTRANFHVYNPYYHELSEFLHSIMPKRPLGLNYSTIGFIHFGKVQ